MFGIAVGAMIVAGGTGIHRVIIVSATGIAAGAMTATVIVIAYISSRAVAARTTKHEESSDFAALFFFRPTRLEDVRDCRVAETRPLS